jgi:hypothetical protein
MLVRQLERIDHLRLSVPLLRLCVPLCDYPLPYCDYVYPYVISRTLSATIATRDQLQCLDHLPGKTAEGMPRRMAYEASQRYTCARCQRARIYSSLGHRPERSEGRHLRTLDAARMQRRIDAEGASDSLP